MTSLELTDRLISDIEKSIKVVASVSATKNDLIQSIDKYLNLIAQLINLDGEQLISHQAGDQIDFSGFLTDIKEHKEKILLRMEHFIDEDPFVTLPDNQSISGELINQLNLLNRVVNPSV